MLNLRHQLDRFISEEKERTMMCHSDIPDPESLNPMLPAIIEEDVDARPTRTGYHHEKQDSLKGEYDKLFHGDGG